MGAIYGIVSFILIVLIIRAIGAWMLRIDEVIKNQKKMITILGMKVKIFSILAIFIVVISCDGYKSDPTEFESAKIYYKKGFYLVAMHSLENFENDSTKYDSPEYDSVGYYKKVISKAINQKRITDSIAIIEIKRRKDSTIISQKRIKDSTTVVQIKEATLAAKKFRINKLVYYEVPDILRDVSHIEIWHELANEYENTNEKDVSLAVKELKNSLSSLGLRIYPHFREQFHRIMKKNLWREDINVNLGGSKNTILTFTGAIFAANRNKEEFQEAISSTVKNLKFKRINYKWYEYDSDYTYFTIHSKNDGNF